MNELKMNKAVFLDRDGVINEVMYHDEKGIYSAMNVEEFNILPGVKEALEKLKSLGFKLIVVTNQPGVAYGYLKQKDLESMNKKMIDLGVDGVYVCPHHPRYSGECECRKPKPGLINDASKENEINIEESYLIGDNISDIKINLPFKAKIFIGSVRCDLCKKFDEENAKPDYIAKNLLDAVEIIKAELQKKAKNKVHKRRF